MWGALLVTLSVIYLEFKAHLPSMATTAFCSDTPSHPVWAQWDYHLFFNRRMTQHTPRLFKGYLTKKESAASDDLKPVEMVWDLDRRVKEKQPTRAQHMRELLQDGWKSIPGEAG